MNHCENHDLRIDNVIDNEQRMFESDVDRIMRLVWFIGIRDIHWSTIVFSQQCVCRYL